LDIKAEEIKEKGEVDELRQEKACFRQIFKGQQKRHEGHPNGVRQILL